MRIVSLSPSFTEILKALGEAVSLAGITDHCPAAGEPAVAIGSPKFLEISKIEGLRPDVILADLNENRLDEIRRFEKKFRVLSFDVRSVSAAKDAVGALARLTGKTAEGAEMIRAIQAEEEENKKIFSGQASVPALILLWNRPYLTVNFDTYASRLLESSGGVNVFHEDPVREFPIEMEDMIEKNPELLFLAKAPFPFTSRHAAGFRKYRVFSKIRIELIDGKLFSRFGPRTAEALKTLRGILTSLAVPAKGVGP